MAENIVDSLVVELELRTDKYKDADKAIDKLVTKTEKKQVDNEKKAKQRHEAQRKRFDETRRAAQSLGGGLMKLAGIAGAVLGVGAGAAGLAGMVLALTNTETALRRAGVATGKTNREMLALSATARRLGGDAKSGGDAFASLAREQKLLPMTGSAPNLQALASFGVNIAADVPHMLQQLQGVYRASNPQQQNFMESRLTAAGVSPDVVVAMKSSVDAIDAYTKSMQETSEENRKAMDALSDATASVVANLRNMANTLATVVAPYVQRLGEYLHDATADLADFTDDVAAAGGGLEGLQKVLEERAPRIGEALRVVTSAVARLGEAVDLSAYGLELIGGLFKEAWNKLANSSFGKALHLNEAGGAVSSAAQQAGKGLGIVWDAVKWAWTTAVPEARRNGPDVVGGLIGDHGGAARLTPPRAGGAALPTPAGNSARAASAGAITKQDIVNYAIARGLPLNAAIGLAVNAEGESSLIPSNVNKTSGAAGLFQFLSKDRVEAFKRFAGTTPDKADWRTQMDFVLSDPAERKRLEKSLTGADSPYNAALGISRVYEAHGRAAEDMRRANAAQQFAQQYADAGGAGGAGGTSIQIQNVNITANNPQQLVDGIKRVSGVTNFASGQR